ncbi:MAG: protein kinase [Verrucomicrobiales bacterium]|nr:protein kinase [Verrucomicrobiales bacterium]
MSSSALPCTRCGRPLPTDRTGGNCPWCLFAATLGDRPTEPAVEPSEDREFESFADFDRLEEVGRGGTSIVFRAQQVSVQRVVALKVLHGSAVAHRDAYERLQIEAEAVGRLEHPNIVSLYGVGREKGTHFLVLRFFEHGSLADALRRRRYSPEEAARLVATAAQAVHHAHQRGVIHRDLKPSNLMMDEAGAPHVADFGLARLADNESRLTLTQSVMGTPSYMAPEQAKGDTRSVGTPADIYALGAVLYEMLSGRPPFMGATTVETLRQVLEDDPPSLRIWVPGISRDLEAICLHCLEKAPERRYASAAGLAKDLERWLNHETLTVRPGTAGTQLVRWVRRRPIIAGLVAAVAVSLLIGLVSTSWQWRRATASEHRTAAMLYAANMNLAQSDWQAGNLTRLRSLLRETSANPKRGFEWYYWQKQAHQELITIRAHPSPVLDIDFSPDGHWLATASDDGTARIWDWATAREQRVLRHGAAVHSIAFSRTGNHVVTGDERGWVRLWDLETGQAELAFKAGEKSVTAALSPDGERIVTAGWDSTVKGWDAADGRCLFESKVDWGRVKCLAYLPDGHRFLTGGEDRTLRAWDALTGRELLVRNQHKGDVNAIDLMPDGTLCVTAGYDGTIRVWKLPELEEIKVLSLPDLRVTWASVSPDGQRVVSSSMYVDFVPRIWRLNPDGETAMRRMTAHEFPIARIKFSPDGTRIATACADGTVRLWDTDGSEHVIGRASGSAGAAVFPGRDRWLVPRAGVLEEYHLAEGVLANVWPELRGPVAVSSDAKRVAASRKSGEVVVLDAMTRAELKSWSHTLGPLQNVSFSSDGTHLAAASSSGAALWNAATGALIHQWSEGRSAVRFGPLADRLVLVTADGAKVCRVSNGSVLSGWPADVGGLVSFSRDGRWMATTLGDRKVALRDENGREVAVIAPPVGQHHLTRFSTDGEYVAVGATWGAGEITLCRVPSGKVEKVLVGHTGFISSLTFSHDGRRLLSTSLDGSARLWDTASGRELLILRQEGGLPAECVDAVFTTNASAIVTFYRDGTARRWDAATSEQVIAWDRAEAEHQDMRRAAAASAAAAQ